MPYDRNTGFLTTLAVLAAAFPAAASAAPTAQDDDAVIRPDSALVIERVGAYGRRPFHVDHVHAAMAAGAWVTPGEGETFVLPGDQSRQWQAIDVRDNGWFQHSALRGGYMSVQFDSDDERIAMLHAAGQSAMYVNGELRGPDVYQLGITQLPVLVREGTNEILIHCSRGRARVSLHEPPAAHFITRTDMTTPDLLVGEPIDTWLGVIVVNATKEPLRGATIAAIHDQHAPTISDVGMIPPLSIRKQAVRVRGPAPEETGDIEIRLVLACNDDGDPTHTESVTLTAREPHAKHRRTFVSRIDGSVQYYAVVPAQTDGDQTGDNESGDDEKAEAEADQDAPGLVLTLHGASVEATNQANAYQPKDWCHIVAPTNRRPFGFDWEDWGRLDALEVLDVAGGHLDHDPRRVYLTGHSMGGHGTWHIGAMVPDRFAAIAPSAGWVSFWSYSSGARYEDASPIETLLHRAANASDTIAQKRNYLHHGVYILHGDADDNVPVREARSMRRELGQFHPNFAYYERPGAGHWWGSACVDWPPLFDFLRRNTRSTHADTRDIEFHTSNPGISARSYWATVYAQHTPLAMSSITLTHNAEAHRISGTTDNVAVLRLDLAHVDGDEPLTIELDDQTLNDVPRSDDGVVWLARSQDGTWSQSTAPPASNKGPRRNGPFKAAFDHDVLYIVATGGSDAETAWAWAKARYDAETFWYRGNGAIDVIADVDFNPADHPDRSIILLGNADTNAAWDALLAASPVQIDSAGVHIGEQSFEGDDVACLFIQPRSDSDAALVGVIGGTALHGMRITDRLPDFVSGAGYPDVVCFDSRTLTGRRAGVLAAGYFANDWAIDPNSIAFE